MHQLHEHRKSAIDRYVYVHCCLRGRTLLQRVPAEHVDKALHDLLHHGGLQPAHLVFFSDCATALHLDGSDARLGDAAAWLAHSRAIRCVPMPFNVVRV